MKLDLTGKTFGRLTVLRDSGETRGGDTMWDCVCRCGIKKAYRGYLLRKGITKSCGCLLKDWVKTQFTTHGLSETPEFHTWTDMHSRCYNPKATGYPRYGALGIKISKEWHSFENFFADMGQKPTAGHSIDRTDNSKGYCKSNCRWATNLEQGRNTSRVIRFSIGSVEHCLTEWAELAGVPASRIRGRLLLGWGYERAVYAPKNSKYRRAA